jgi:phosphatidylglycerophosphate synthase
MVALRGSGYWGFALAGVMLEVNSILDSVDGELARLRFQYSKLGQWLDNLSDDVVDNLFIVAVGHALGGWWATLALAGAGGRVLVSLITYLDVYRRTGTGDVFAFRWWFETDKATADDVYDPRSPITWLRSFGRRDTFVFAWMVACLAGFPAWVVGHGLLIGAVQVGLLVLHFTVGARRGVR